MARRLPSVKRRSANSRIGVANASSLIHIFGKGEATHHGSQQFVDAIYHELHAGYGFIPFIGAGFSVSAGIPIIQQVRTYLRRCICLALGIDSEDRQYLQANHFPDHLDRQLWNPRTDRWPPLVDRNRREPVKWLELMHHKYMCEKAKEQANEPSNAALYLEAYGAMAEWRTALFFLSRLMLEPRHRPRNGSRAVFTAPALGIPSQEVIDSCFREVMRYKRPSLNHTMLAQLSGLLRIDTVLTTNFDALTEIAFAESRNPLEVFDVHLRDTLPAFAAVSRTRAIVKMHGSQSSLRADYSLDGEPSFEDKKRFTEYLAGLELGPDEHAPSNRNHLLIMGVSATEYRTMAFLRNAMQVLSNLKIFWVCYSEQEIDGISRFAQELGPTCEARFLILRHTEAGLCFLHLFQSVRKTLPSHHAVFPSVTQLPLPPLPRLQGNPKSRNYQDFVDTLKEHVKGSALTIASADKNVSGVTSACAEVFRAMERDYVCIWIEMNDISNVDELFETFQEAAYRKLGQSDWTPLYAASDHRPRKLEIKRIADASTKPWILFINARELPGANRETGWTSVTPNGWMDSKEERNNLDTLLSEFAQARKGHVKVVLLCRDPRSDLVARPFKFANKCVFLDGTPGYELVETFREVMAWSSGRDCLTKQRGERLTERIRKARRRFLHTLVLMQRPRHFAAAWARCTRIPDIKTATGTHETCSYFDETDMLRRTWLEDLDQLGLIRWKDGGFIWMHAGIRQELRRMLKDDSEETARIHLGLSQWYLKVFDATGIPPAIFEAVDHLCHAAKNHIEGACRNSIAAQGSQRDRVLRLAQDRVDTARQLLQEHEFLIQTLAYPRASMRRLDFICDFWTSNELDQNPKSSLPDTNSSNPKGSVRQTLDNCPCAEAEELKRRVAKLQCVTTSIACGIAREIGEDRSSYLRLRQLGIRMSENQILAPHEVDERSRARGISEMLRKSLHSQSEKQKDRHKQIQEQAEELSKIGNASISVRRVLDDWVLWWSWCGLLGIASRSFLEADKSLFRALDAARTKHEGLKFSVEQTGQRDDQKTPLTTFDLNSLDLDLKDTADSLRRRGDLYRFYLETLHAIELSSYLFILRAQTDERFDSLVGKTKRRTREAVECFHRAEEFATKGLNLVEAMQNSGVDREGHDLDLLWCKSRLLMHLGVAALRDPTLKKNSRHAMSMMGDAAACLQHASPHRARADLALIELRRAEVRLHEAGTKHLSSFGEFESWMWGCCTGDQTDKAEQRVRAAQKQLKGKLKLGRAALREIAARAADAMRFLGRAEPILRERRRNVWWTTWYFDRKLRAMAIILWASVLEPKGPIPFLGLEDAVRLADTEADNLLNDAVRMIRVDAYRLASVVMSYASCARALDLRLKVDRHAIQLPERLKRMQHHLELAVRQLKQMRDLRIDATEQREQGMDDKAVMFIDEVLNRALDIKKSLPMATDPLLDRDK